MVSAEEGLVADRQKQEQVQQVCRWIRCCIGQARRMAKTRFGQDAPVSNSSDGRAGHPRITSHSIYIGSAKQIAVCGLSIIGQNDFIVWYTRTPKFGGG